MADSITLNPFPSLGPLIDPIKVILILVGKSRYKPKRSSTTRVHVRDSLIREKIWSIERAMSQICIG
jgi:hypothetical protein